MAALVIVTFLCAVQCHVLMAHTLSDNSVCSRDVGTIDTVPNHSSHTTVHLILNATFSCRSTVLAWTYKRSNTQARIFASVWRQEETPSGYFRLIGRNELPPAQLGRHTVRVPTESRIQAEAGDFIGFHYSKDVYGNSEPGALAVEYGNSTAHRRFYHTLTAGYYDENFNVDMPQTFMTNDRRLDLMQPSLQAHVQVDFQAEPEAIVHLYSCKDTTAVLECGNKTIHIVRAVYGQQDTVYGVCGVDNTPPYCTSDATLVLQGACQGMKSCVFAVTDHVLGDPCPGAEEFLDIQYQCLDEAKSIFVSFKKNEARPDKVRAKIAGEPRRKRKPTENKHTTKKPPTTSRAEYVESRSSKASITSTTTTPTQSLQATGQVLGVLRVRADVQLKSTQPEVTSKDKATSSQPMSTVPTTEGNMYVFPLRIPDRMSATTRSPPRSAAPNGRKIQRRRKLKHNLFPTESPSNPRHSNNRKRILHQSAVIAGSIAGIALCMLLVVLVIFCMKRRRYRRGSKDVSNLVQCHLVEGHLLNNPVYSSRPTSAASPDQSRAPEGGSSISSDSSSSPYQVTSLDKHFTYDNIGTAYCSTPVKTVGGANKTAQHGYARGTNLSCLNCQTANKNGEANYENTAQAGGRRHEKLPAYYNVSPVDRTTPEGVAPPSDIDRKLHVMKPMAPEQTGAVQMFADSLAQGGGGSEADGSSLENLALMPPDKSKSAEAKDTCGAAGKQ